MSRVPINDNEDNFADSDVENPEQDESASDFEKLKAERDSLYDRLARATADFKNTQRRLESDFEQRAQYSNSGLIKSVLPVIDNFERALAVDPANADGQSILKGMQIVHDQLLTVLRQQQVEEIAPKAGDPFDPVLHQALLHQDAVYAVPTVVQLLQKGYSLHGRVLRPAQVAVSKTA